MLARLQHVGPVGRGEDAAPTGFRRILQTSGNLYLPTLQLGSSCAGMHGVARVFARRNRRLRRRVRLCEQTTVVSCGLHANALRMEGRERRLRSGGPRLSTSLDTLQQCD